MFEAGNTIKQCLYTNKTNLNRKTNVNLRVQINVSGLL